MCPIIVKLSLSVLWNLCLLCRGTCDLIYHIPLPISTWYQRYKKGKSKRQNQTM